MKPYLVLAGGIVLGKLIASFVIKENDADTTGFIPRAEGIGLDDAAEIGSMVVGVVLAKKFFG